MPIPAPPLPVAAHAGPPALAKYPRARTVVGVGVSGAAVGLAVQLFATSAQIGIWQIPDIGLVLLSVALGWGVVRGSRAARGLFALFTLAIVARALAPSGTDGNTVLTAVRHAGAWFTLGGVILATLSAPARAWFAPRIAD